jgi:hypothetical protein
MNDHKIVWSEDFPDGQVQLKCAIPSWQVPVIDKLIPSWFGWHSEVGVIGQQQQKFYVKEMLLLFLLFKILIDSAAGVLLPNKSLQDRTSCGRAKEW